MAIAFAPPEGFQPPPFDIDFAAYDKACNDYIERLATEARKHCPGDLVGEVIRFPVADGQAQYLVWSERPLNLVHLALGDAWCIPDSHVRGLKLRDVRQQVAGRHALAAHVETERSWWAQQKPGDVLHYDNGFEQYVRCVVTDDGLLRPTALVGNVIPPNATLDERREQGWYVGDIVRQQPDGSVQLGYHATKIVNGEAWQPSWTCVVEAPPYQAATKKRRIDPRGMDGIDVERYLPQPELPMPGSKVGSGSDSATVIASCWQRDEERDGLPIEAVLVVLAHASPYYAVREIEYRREPTGAGSWVTTVATGYPNIIPAAHAYGEVIGMTVDDFEEAPRG